MRLLEPGLNNVDPLWLEQYQLGQAFAMLEKRGADKPESTYALKGRLYKGDGDWILMAVPNAFIRGAFDALDEPGIELPYHTDGRLSAHISVMRPEDLEKIEGGADAITERGKFFSYQLGPLKTVNPAGWGGVSRVWFIECKSPELQNLRKSYGMTPLPNNNKFKFHITVAVRKPNVMGRNATSKAASIAPQLSSPPQQGSPSQHSPEQVAINAQLQTDKNLKASDDQIKESLWRAIDRYVKEGQADTDALPPVPAGADVEVPAQTQVSQEEANYRLASPDEEAAGAVCSSCIHFDQANQGCAVVEGVIGPEAAGGPVTSDLYMAAGGADNTEGSAGGMADVAGVMGEAEAGGEAAGGLPGIKPADENTQFKPTTLAQPIGGPTIGSEPEIPEPVKMANESLTAQLITGNPAFIENNPNAAAYYDAIEAYLKEKGVTVGRDPGEEFTVPPAANLWLGHSRGVSRLPYAPEGTDTLRFGAKDGINHPDDTLLEAGDIPTDAHYIFTDSQRAAIDDWLTKKAKHHPFRQGHQDPEFIAHRAETIEKDKYYIDDSEIHGRGAFASQEYGEGDYIALCGVAHDKDDFDRDEIWLTPFARKLNFSDESNVVLKWGDGEHEGYVLTYAKRPIAEGEELTCSHMYKDEHDAMRISEGTAHLMNPVGTLAGFDDDEDDEGEETSEITEGLHESREIKEAGAGGNDILGSGEQSGETSKPGGRVPEDNAPDPPKRKVKQRRPVTRGNGWKFKQRRSWQKVATQLVRQYFTKQAAIGGHKITIDRPTGFKKMFPTQQGDVEKEYPVDYGYFNEFINPDDNEGLDVFTGQGGPHYGRFMKGTDLSGKWQPDERKWYAGLTDEQLAAVKDLFQSQHPDLIQDFASFDDEDAFSL
jgi:hypothetical protein